MSANFSFDLFRLNIVDIDDIFIFSRLPRTTHEDVPRIFAAAAAPENDIDRESQKTHYRWSLRDYAEMKAKEFEQARNIISIMFARSHLRAEGPVVTPDSIVLQMSESSPPLADVIAIFVDLDRHLVAVEHAGWSTHAPWRAALHDILRKATLQLGLSATLEIEPIPVSHRIVTLFKSFDAITRLRVTLRLPNPELTRYTKELFEELKRSRVREYAQDMKNPEGISKDETARPYASAALADQGYKKGDVVIEGSRQGKFARVRAGSKASRGSIPVPREVMRGLVVDGEKTKPTKTVEALCDEIDRIHPKDEDF